MKYIFFIIILFLLFYSGISHNHTPLWGAKTVFTYEEPNIKVPLDYEVIKDTLWSRTRHPDVLHTRIRRLANLAQPAGENLPGILEKNFAKKGNKIAITSHEKVYFYKDFFQFLNTQIKPVEDTIFVYTQRYAMRYVLAKVENYHGNPDFLYKEFHFLDAKNNRLSYILGYVDNIGFVYAKHKIIGGSGKPEMREWNLSKINQIPIKDFIANANSKYFHYFEEWNE